MMSLKCPKGFPNSQITLRPKGFISTCLVANWEKIRAGSEDISSMFQNGDTQRGNSGFSTFQLLPYVGFFSAQGTFKFPFLDVRSGTSVNQFYSRIRARRAEICK